MLKNGNRGNVRRVLRRAIKNCLILVDWLAALLSTTYLRRKVEPNHTKDDRYLLIAAPGNGNIGDQAMTEAVLENVSGSIDIVVRNAADIDLSHVDGARVTLHELPRLLYERPGAAWRTEYRRFLGLLNRASTCAVIGADIMDGAYNPRASYRRALMAAEAARRTETSSILGFSWNESPHLLAIKSMRQASRAGVRIMARDPLSMRRLVSQGIEAIQSSDLVFSATSLRKPLLTPRGPFALINISAHIEGTHRQTASYIEVINSLVHSGMRVVLLPHVSRPGSDDLTLAQDIHRRLDHASVDLIPSLLPPAEVRFLSKNAEFVVTGRMHLSIIALSQGTPAVVLSSQGKVRGLEELFPQSVVCIDPTTRLAADILRGIRTIQNVEPSELSTVRGLSARNFASNTQVASSSAVAQ